MVLLLVENSDYGRNPNTNAVIDVTGADWQVASDETFAKDKIVIESLNDKTNLSSIIFSESLDPNKKWYGRVRHLLTTGWTEWSNIEVFTPITSQELVSDDDIPSKVSHPLITTTSDANNHDTTLFEIHADGYSVVGNATHVATTYFIEDIFGKVIWSNEFDMINKNKFRVTDIVLDSETIYRIKAVFHSSSNDSSQIATKTIYVTGGGEINLVNYLDVVNHAEKLPLEVNHIEGTTGYTFEIISIFENTSSVIWSVTTNGATPYKTEVPANTLKPDNNYYLRIKRNVEGASFKYYPFRVDNYNNSDILDKSGKKHVLHLDLENITNLIRGQSLPFVFEAYSSLNHIVKEQIPLDKLKIKYDNENTAPFRVDLENKLLIADTGRTGQGTFRVEHTERKDLKTKDFIIMVK